MLNRRNLLTAVVAGASVPRLIFAQTPEVISVDPESPLITWDELVERDTSVRFAVVDTKVPEGLPDPVHAPWQSHVLAIGETLEKWTERIGTQWWQTGVNPSELVVAVDPGDHFAAFAFSIANYLGYSSVVLDGGLKAIGEPVPQPSEMSAELEPEPNPGTIRSMEAVRGFLEDDDVQILDARSEEEWALGHISGALNLPYTEMVTDDGYRDAEEITRLFESAGVDLRKAIVVYCATGPRASVLALSALLAGGMDVSVYLGSWTEWSNDPDNPTNMGGVNGD